MALHLVRPGVRTLALGFAVLIAACAEALDPGTSVVDDVMCTISTAEILNGGPGKDGIPALSDPTLVSVGDPGADYLLPNERVIAIMSATGPVAVPLQIMWWHEIVNMEVDGAELAITHCPLTGSSLAFDRGPIGGVEFGVSGLLYRNNLIMYDRSTSESLWPQMSRGARCGSQVGTDLTMVPVIEMTWEGWSTLHPDTRVISSETGHTRSYEAYPYGNYRAEDNPSLLFQMSAGVDTRRPPKERVLGLPTSEGGIAYPFGELDLLGPVAAVEHPPGSDPFGPRVVFWDGAGRAAALYEAVLDGVDLSFEVSGDAIVDIATGSEWGVDGVSTSGPNAGRRLEPVADAYVAYWFAWAVFEPRTAIWPNPGTEG